MWFVVLPGTGVAHGVGPRFPDAVYSRSADAEGRKRAARPGLGASYPGRSDLPDPGKTMVTNKEVSGQQSFELLERFDRDAAALKPCAVILGGFINDIYRSDRAKIAKLVQTRETFATMVARARASASTRHFACRTP